MWIYLIPVNPWGFEHTGVTTFATPSWSILEYTDVNISEKKYGWVQSEKGEGHSRRKDEGCLCTGICSPARGKFHLSFSATHWESLVSDSYSLFSPQWLVLVRSPWFPWSHVWEDNIFSIAHSPCLMVWTARELECDGLVMHLMQCPTSNLAAAVFSLC